MSATTPSDEDRPSTFEEVFDAELKSLAELRESTAADGTPPLVGLAFSGGGIRSATFNLGFLQGLANRRALHAFDYLSTVSGGGYIGAWFSALLHRQAADKPADATTTQTVAETYLTNDRPHGELGTPDSAPVRFIRRYADYLTPRLGLSGDTFALISTLLRNVVVIQLLLLSLLVSVFSVMLLFARGDWIADHNIFVDFLRSHSDLSASLGLASAAAGQALLLPALMLAVLSLVSAMVLQPDSWQRETKRTLARGSGQKSPGLRVAALVVLSALASGLIAAAGIDQTTKSGQPLAAGQWIWILVIGYCLAWSRAIYNLAAGLATLLAGALLGALLWIGIGPLSEIVGSAPFGHTVALAPLVALGLYGFVITVHLALAGTCISEESHEWWARLGGQCVAVVLAWTLAFGFLLYMPPLLERSVESALAGGALWSGLSWLGAHFAKGMDTGGKGSVWWKEWLAKLAPWIFVVGLLGLVAWGYTALLLGVSSGEQSDLECMLQAYWNGLNDLDTLQLLAIAGAAGLVVLILINRIDLNIFSAHAFYRNRLARSFLGASHAERAPNRYTGFDPDDDLLLKDLQRQRPIHLINANANLTGGDDLAWQTRRGASFVFTPHACGFSTLTSSGKAIGGYRPTAEYAGGTISLATATAVSGAAASPNMGFHTATSVAALLTMFNLRLARWCPNPERKRWNFAAPRWGGAFFFAELFGMANGWRAWLNLSDGGHFDNLGIYELARRRAALILATDVGADPDYHFDDLAMLKRKLWTDFGINLHIDETVLAAIRPGAANPDRPDDPRFSECHWANGRLVYPDGREGILIYVKSSLTRDIPLDVRQYKDTNPSFPHESTADQWFDEDQFEAYRRLGQHIAEKLCCHLTSSAESADRWPTVGEIIAALIKKLEPPSATEKTT